MSNSAQAGDVVRYLNSVGGGRVLRVDGSMAIVDDDGFETPVPLRECVVVTRAADVKAAPAPQRATVTMTAPAQNKDEAGGMNNRPTPAVAAAVEEEEYEETAEGEKLNVMLAFEPADRRKLTDGEFDAYLINDSNYYLYFTLLSAGEESEDWTCRYAGRVEPGIQLLLGQVAAGEVSEFARVRVQAVAFKEGKSFSAKEPVDVKLKVDTTRFFKVHCFKPNMYFDTDVLALELVHDDRPCGVSPSVSAQTLRGGAESRPGRQPVRRRQQRPRPLTDNVEVIKGDTIVVDLHINELLDSTAGMSAADILNYQVDVFRRVMDGHLRDTGQKIVFIHGKGEGVLRGSLEKELTHRYRGHDFQDASFAEYGFGATQVTIRNIRH